MTNQFVRVSLLILTGIVLISVGAAPVQIEDMDGHEAHLSEPVSDCTSSLHRPINKSVEKPELIGTVSRLEENQSLVKVSYTTTKHRKDNDFTISIYENSRIVNHSENLQRVGDKKLEETHHAGQFWIIYEPGTAWGQSRYPSTAKWLFAPTPEHGPNVVLSPENQGYIGRNNLFLGDYEIVKHQSGCQSFEVIKPKGTDFDAQRKLRVMGSAARLLNFGHRYPTVRIFATPFLRGDLGGFVPKYENEILLVGKSSVRNAENIWVHEYVHTLQWDQYDKELSWLNEGSATYYAARVSLELNLISEAEYDRWLVKQIAYEPRITLSEATHEKVAYKWGSVILAEIAARSYETATESSFNEEYDEIDQYGTDGYEEFDNSLNRLGLNQSYKEDTRETIFKGSNPAVNQAYQSGFGTYARWYFLFKKFLIFMGIILVGEGVRLKIPESKLLDVLKQ